MRTIGDILFDLGWDNLGKIGEEYHGNCPLCSGKETFFFTKSRRHTGPASSLGSWRCRACHREDGTAIELVRNLYGYTEVQAFEHLGISRSSKAVPLRNYPSDASAPHEDIPFVEWQDAIINHLDEYTENLLSPRFPEAQKALDILRRRGIDEKLIEQHQLGFSRDDHEIRTKNLRKIRVPGGVVVPCLDFKRRLIKVKVINGGVGILAQKKMRYAWTSGGDLTKATFFPSSCRGPKICILASELDALLVSNYCSVSALATGSRSRFSDSLPLLWASLNYDDIFILIDRTHLKTPHPVVSALTRLGLARAPRFRLAVLSKKSPSAVIEACGVDALLAGMNRILSRENEEGNSSVNREEELPSRAKSPEEAGENDSRPSAV